MFCPICQSPDIKVVDSRGSTDGMSIRRRRECTACEYRFSTLEQIELLDIIVIKRTGKREAYQRDKILEGIKHSLIKLPYGQEDIDQLLFAIERDIQKKKQREISSKVIGDIVMDQLKAFDHVGYIRFASIYRAFSDVDTFKETVQSLKKNS
ncbi:transcriptional regulator NrdR [Patescibacteria group bacterium]|nr:transcriptional regulator NrdR [Patescibacteria group bacterium]MBU1721887.1 transcriptional regulator NrdR [Patescibacteria group bacterium]MBU1900881.1 transcriptional regulator NrdR [Patescibacteria group bacterium]